MFESVPRAMRVELWKSSLQRRGSGVPAARSYADLAALGAVVREAGEDIEKDLARTFPATRRFAGAEGQAALRRVLRAYAALDPHVGYCQVKGVLGALGHVGGELGGWGGSRWLGLGVGVSGVGGWERGVRGWGLLGAGRLGVWVLGGGADPRATHDPKTRSHPCQKPTTLPPRNNPPPRA